MQTKFFEIRDRATRIPVMAQKLAPAEDTNQETLFSYYGWNGDAGVILTRLDNVSATNNPYDYDDRTMSTAHIYIDQNFDELPNYSVVDVRYILGEQKEPAKSEIWQK